MAKKKALAFVIQSKQHLNKLLPIAEHFSDKYAIDLIISDDRISAQIPKITNSKVISVVESIRNGFDNISKPRYRFHQLKALAKKIFKFVPFKKLILNYTSKLLRYLYKLINYSRFLILRNSGYVTHSHIKRINIIEANLQHKFSNASAYEAIFFGEANVEFYTELFLQIIPHKRSIIVPYTFCSPSEPAMAYYQNPEFLASSEHKTHLSKKWFYNYKGKELMRMPLKVALKMESMKISPPQPWIQESTSATYICSESEQLNKHYSKFKIPEKQLKIVGDINHSIIATVRSNKEELRKKLKVKNGQSMVVFAVYPDFFMKHKPSDHKDYIQSLRLIINELAKVENNHVFLSLHPSLNPSNFKNLTKPGKVEISSLPVANLIAICDYYVASISATIKWAIANGTPVINYDLYKFRYGDYLEADGVLHCETFSEFQSCVKHLSDTKHLQKLAKKQEKIAKSWGVLDTKYFTRLEELLK